MNLELIIFIVNQAIAAAMATAEAFQRVQGRYPTIEEWQALDKGWKSPEQIEAEVRARLDAAKT